MQISVKCWISIFRLILIFSHIFILIVSQSLGKWIHWRAWFFGKNNKLYQLFPLNWCGLRIINSYLSSRFGSFSSMCVCVFFFSIDFVILRLFFFFILSLAHFTVVYLERVYTTRQTMIVSKNRCDRVMFTFQIKLKTVIVMWFAYFGTVFIFCFCFRFCFKTCCCLWKSTSSFASISFRITMPFTLVFILLILSFALFLCDAARTSI